MSQIAHSAPHDLATHERVTSNRFTLRAPDAEPLLEEDLPVEPEPELTETQRNFLAYQAINYAPPSLPPTLTPSPGMLEYRSSAAARHSLTRLTTTPPTSAA